MKQVISPNEYKHLASDSAMIQAAVDEAVKVGATVEIPSFNERTQKNIWELDVGIRLHSGSSVVLDNCHLRLMDNKYIHFFQNSNLIDGDLSVKKADRQYDISLVGRGNAVLDGGNPVDMCEADFNIYDENGDFVKSVKVHGQPYMAVNIAVVFQNVERVQVSGLRFIHTRYWSMCFWFCSFGTVRDISVEAMNNVPNQDGINLRVGCHNFLLDNINGLTGDDTVALTALDSKRAANTDLCPDIHHIIIRNIRSRQTGECDIIRILNRGGPQIYNILIDGVMDLTDPNETDRPLAAIRIGDLCDYPLRLNKLGEVRNLVIRNVSCRGRFGAYIANSLADAVFDNFQMYGDAGIGMYFNGCEMENVTVKDLTYDRAAAAPETDLGYECIFHRVKINELNAVHFNNCTGKNIRFDGLRTGKNLSYAFGGNSEIDIQAEHLRITDENTQLTSAAHII